MSAKETKLVHEIKQKYLILKICINKTKKKNFFGCQIDCLNSQLQERTGEKLVGPTSVSNSFIDVCKTAPHTQNKEQ